MPEGDGAARRPGLARIHDVAREAGVSTATVDRVLNRRPGVRAVTVQRVLRAAAGLGYILDPVPEAPAAKPMRIAVLLPVGTNQFLGLLARTFADSQETLKALNLTARVEVIKSFNPDLLARQLLSSARSADGIAFMALEHPAVRDAVDRLAERGVPCVTLISDIADARRAAYVGLDNRSAGRSAAWLVGRLIGRRRGTVAMVAGSRSYRAHEEREAGFLHMMEEAFPEIEVAGLREGQDDEARNHRQTRALLAQHPDLAGIYNIGGAAGGIGRALKEVRREREVVFVGHGLTPDTRALLVDGTMDAVITQNPRQALLDCATAFANIRAGRDPMAGLTRSRGEIILRENMP